MNNETRGPNIVFPRPPLRSAARSRRVGLRLAVSRLALRLTRRVFAAWARAAAVAVARGPVLARARRAVESFILLGALTAWRFASAESQLLRLRHEASSLGLSRYRLRLVATHWVAWAEFVLLRRARRALYFRVVFFGERRRRAALAASFDAWTSWYVGLPWGGGIPPFFHSSLPHFLMRPH